MGKKYLEDGDLVYSTGAWMKWNTETLEFEFVGVDGHGIYFDGKEVEGIGTERPFIEE